MNDLTDQQKSVLLAKAMGWRVKLAQSGEPRWALEDEQRRQLGGSIYDEPSVYKDVDLTYSKLCPDLYDPANMALAWRVLNWAYDHPQIEDQGRHDHFIKWWREANLNTKLPADAQRLWLDKILELATNAGIVSLHAADPHASTPSTPSMPSTPSTPSTQTAS